MDYKLRGEFGEPFFEGTEKQVNMIKDAMIKYGIRDDKLCIIYPQHYDFKLPKDLKKKMVEAIIQAQTDGRDYGSYIRDEVGCEVKEYHDYELLSQYEESIWSDEDDELLVRAGDLLNTFELETAIAEG